MRSHRWRWALLVSALLTPQSARAQTEAARLIQQAREEIDALNVDSAFTILQRALRRAPTGAERVRAFTLLGVTQLSRDDRVGARSAFEQALRLDGGLRVDSLTELHTDLRTVFSEVRAALGITDAVRDGAAAPRLTVAVNVAVDTTVAATGGLVRIGAEPSEDARVILSVSAIESPGQLLWADTAEVGESAASLWNLRGLDGRIVAPGRYALRAAAFDPAGRASPTVERILLVERTSIDTLPSPAALAPMAPETLLVNRGSPRGLAGGLAIAASAVLMPSLLGSAELQTGASYPTSYAVAVVVGAASVVGFVRGHRTRAMPANALLNAQAREQDTTERTRVAVENARQREAAPVRVRLEGGGR